MMHRCSSGGGNVCSCGLFHSMLFPMPNHHYQKSSFEEYDDMNSSSSSSSSFSSVDCTLSLGTPSTRLSTDDDDGRIHRRPTSSSSYFCWDLLQPKNSTNPSPPSSSSHKPNRGQPNNDPLLARRCANCDTTSTPLWRNGPRGPKSLCNACGIRFKKEERRATAANVNSSSTSSGNNNNPLMEQHYSYNNNSTWVHHQQSQKMGYCFSPAAANEFRFIEDSERDSDTGIPLLSWRLNVTDRPGLVHDFTR